jgi:hypothetical protein
MTIHILGRLRDFWRRLIASKYVQALEAEVARLRAENRALMNSILGIAGIPPVITPDSGAAQSGVTAAIAKTGGSVNVGSGALIPAPVRRRSWQQVNRALEMEAAKKKEPEGSAS